MIVPYNPSGSSSFFKDYYLQQRGNGLAVFKGATVQKGHGIGGFFKGLLRGALPLIRSGAKVVGKGLVNTGAGIVKDLIDGQDLSSAAKQNFSSAGRQTLKTLQSTIIGRKRGSKRGRSITSTSFTNRANIKRKRPNQSSKITRSNIDKIFNKVKVA